jgi:outer membrane protein assembly factor BamB
LFLTLNYKHGNRRTTKSHQNHDHDHSSDRDYQPHDNVVLAVDRKSGDVTGSTVIAAENRERVSWGGVALDSNSVYATSVAGLCRIGKESSEVRWTNEIGENGSEYAPLSTGERVYACAREEGQGTEVVSVWKDTRELSWSTTLSGEVSGTLTEGGRSVFVTTNRGVHALDSETGERRWSKRLQFGTARTPRYVSGSVIDSRLIDDGERTLVVTAIDEASGEKRWKETLPAGRPDSLSLDETRVYVGTESGIIALDRSTGRQVWTYSLDGRTTRYGPPVVTSNAVMAVDLDGRLHAVRKEQGTEAWVADEIAGQQVRTQLVCLGQRAYLGTAPGEIRVLTPDSGFSLP